MGIYWLLADYGRSIVRPIVALVASVYIFQMAYSTILSGQVHSNPTVVRAFAIANAVPFVGALAFDKDLKTALLCGDRPTDEASAQKRQVPVCVPLPKWDFQILALGQSIVSASLIFFLGLALRNFFKLH